jgi:uncharacterized iron-regulated membrane protein
MGAGLIFVFMGLTGCVLVWQPEIDRWWAPELWRVDGATPRTLDETATALRSHGERELPGRKLTWIWIPYGGKTAVGWYSPLDGEALSDAPEVWIDRTSSAIRGTRVWRRTPAGFLFYLHSELFAGGLGKWLVGWTGVLLIGSLLSGLLLWWPASWKSAFRFQRGASAGRRLYDFHRTVGISALLPLAIVAITGIILAWPETSKRAVAAIAPVASEPSPCSTETGVAISLEEALRNAQAVFPDAVLTDFQPPTESLDPLWFGFLRPGEPGDYAGKSAVWVDQGSGAVLASRDALAAPAGSRVLDWALPLHFGTGLGLPGRIAVFVTGITPLGLLVTGMMFRRQRLKRLRSRA